MCPWRVVLRLEFEPEPLGPQFSVLPTILPQSFPGFPFHRTPPERPHCTGAASLKRSDAAEEETEVQRGSAPRPPSPPQNS